MPFTLTIRLEAELDIDEQYLAYESKRVGLGHDFVLCVEEALVAHNAGGFFSKEWVAWCKIFAACNHCDWLTSIHLRSLFNGKSVNTAGFLLAALKDQGLVQRREGKSRHYVLTDKARKAAAPV